MVNHYPNGKYCIALHSDTDLYAKNKSVITLSLGASRKFLFEKKSDKFSIETVVNHGDLLVCFGDVQDHWKHGIPEEPNILECRYSLTFRGMKTKTSGYYNNRVNNN